MVAKALVLVVTSLAASAAAAQTPDTSWRATGLVHVGVNPLQVLVAPGLEIQHVYHHDRSPLWDNLHVKAGLRVLGTPISPGAQLDLEWMPLSPVVLRASYTLLFFTGMSLGLGPGLGFASADDPFDAGTLESRKGEEEAEIVQRAVLSLTLRARLWRMRATSEVALAGWYVPGSRGAFWYDLFHDSMVARGQVDGTLTSRSMLLLQAWQGQGAAQLLAGAINEYNLALRADIERDRVGGIVIYTPSDRLLGTDRPTIVLSAGATVLHRHRTNELWVHAAVVLGWDL